jgi:hypothetical protein
MNIAYSNFPVTGDIEKDLKSYQFTCDGHIRTLGLKIAERQGNPPHDEPTGQMARNHDARLAELTKHQEFWTDQSIAAEAGYLLEVAGQDPQWGMRHQSLRAEAIKYGRMMHRTEFETYVASAFAPKDYAGATQPQG